MKNEKEIPGCSVCGREDCITPEMENYCLNCGSSSCDCVKDHATLEVPHDMWAELEKFIRANPAVQPGEEIR